MIRPIALALTAAVVAAAAPPAATAASGKPVIPVAAPVPAAAPAPAAAPHLVPGGMLPAVMIMVFPEQEPPALPDRLDRIAHAVEGAESSYGRDPRMWRPDLYGPQGPMQVSAAAAFDVGGGDRFDAAQNWTLGRAYLARMYARYGDWRDTVLSYNWGPGNVDRWIGAGRPAEWLRGGLSRYIDRILYDNDGGADAGPALDTPPPAAAPSEPVHPEVRADSIGSPRLRRRVSRNDHMIGQLHAFLDIGAAGEDYSMATLAWLKTVGIDPQHLAEGDAAATQSLQMAGTKLVFAIIRIVSRRPGYGDFAAPRMSRHRPNLAAVRMLASVLVEKLEEENAALALIDAHRNWAGTNPPPKPVHVSLVRR